MANKILILNGSGKSNGNTSLLVDSFIKGAEKSGNKITTYFLESMKINGCKACFQGGKDESDPCVMKDDMEQIYLSFREADIVVLASPLYYWQISGQLKIVLDRLFAFEECNPNLLRHGKESILLMTAEGNGYEETNYWYDRLMDHLGWENIGKVLCGGVYYKNDIQGRTELEDAEKLGASLR